MELMPSQMCEMALDILLFREAGYHARLNA
jgi:hypothetical protein